jgi:X-X-X-Leu-X-X-Gly heptad repeat protein
MRLLKKVLPAILSAVLIVSLSSLECAAQNSSVKEEVVYAMTDAGGAVTGVYVVNIFGSGDITDYGDYSEVKMLNTNAPITQEGDTITFSSASERVYYEGTLKNVQIPWNISIRFFMDGTEYSPNDIAGKSGSLKILVSIKENPACDSVFFEHYALQMSVPLSTDICAGIQSEGATVADAGSVKRLTYIILPGSKKDLVITAKATDFEMDSIEITGLLLNTADFFNLDASKLDLSDITDSISELQDGTKELNDGANALCNGIGQLKDAASSLKDGAGSLAGGLDTLGGKSNDLLSGAVQMADALFASATAQLRSQLMNAGMSQAEAAQITLTQSTYTDVLTALSGKMTGSADALAALKTQLDGVVVFLSGLQAYTQGVADAAAGAESVVSGASGLTSGAYTLLDGAKKLADGTNELSTKTGSTDLMGDIQKKIDAVIKDFSSDDFSPVSFVSEKNTHIKLLQFVIRTTAVVIPETEMHNEAAVETLTFWQKLLRLFGL